jgi:hypothetical protein
MSEAPDFDPSSSNLNLQFRREILIRELGKVIGETNLRLKSSERKRTVGDYQAAELTYSDVVRRFPTSQSPELPDGFSRSDDPVIEAILQEYHLAAINSYLELGRSGVRPTQLGGLGVVELQDLYPNEFERYLTPLVEGYRWYRGYKVDVNSNDSILLLQSWMQPWYEGGSPFPVMYVAGNPDDETTQIIARDFGLKHAGQYVA